MATWMLYAFAALAGWGLIAPVATHYVTQWKTQTVERAACNTRVATELHKLEIAINEAVDHRIAEAEAAASAVTPTPTIPAELAALCQADKHCREHKP